MLREIEVFRAIMTSGSTSKAAMLLGISQPAVSQSVRKLEERAGLQLFNRLRGRLQPTPEAHVFLHEVERCFVGLDALEHRLQSLKQFGVGRLQLASYPAFGMGFMPRVLERHDLGKCAVAVSLQIMSSRDVRERLLAGQCDIGLMADEASTAGLEHSVFARVNGVLVMAAEHPLAAKRRIQASDVKGTPFLSLNPEDTARRRLEQALATAGIVPSTLVETPYAVTICEMALNGLGVGLVNPITALAYVERGLVLRAFEMEVPFTCIMATPAGRPTSGEARAFMTSMRHQLVEDLRRVNAVIQ